MKKILLIGLSSIFVIVGLIILSLGLNLLYKAKVSEDWPTVTGKVISSDLVTQRSDDSDFTYSAEIVYQYAVDHIEIIGNKIRIVDMSNTNAATAMRDVNDYPEHKAVMIYYNPDDPYESVLEPGKLGGGLFVIMFGFAFTVVGSLFFVIGLYTKRENIDLSTKFNTRVS